MHILDVISSVSRSSKCTKIVGGWGFAPDPIGGAYSAPRTPLGPTSKALTSQGRGRQNDLCPWEPETLAPPLAFRYPISHFYALIVHVILCIMLTDINCNCSFIVNFISTGNALFHTSARSFADVDVIIAHFTPCFYSVAVLLYRDHDHYF